MTDSKKASLVVFDQHAAYDILDPPLLEVIAGGIVLDAMNGDADCGNSGCGNNYCIEVGGPDNAVCTEWIPNAYCPSPPPPPPPHENYRCGSNPNC